MEHVQTGKLWGSRQVSYSERHMEELHLPAENLCFSKEKPKVAAGCSSYPSSRPSLVNSRKRAHSSYTGPSTLEVHLLPQCAVFSQCPVMWR